MRRDGRADSHNEHLSALPIAVTATVSIAGNLAAYDMGRKHLKRFSDEVRAGLVALDVASGATPGPNVVITPFPAPALRAGPYLAAVDAFGSAAGIVQPVAAVRVCAAAAVSG